MRSPVYQVAIVFIMIAFNTSSAIVLECEFKQQVSHWGVEYACVVTRLKTSLNDRTVTSINGQHDSGMTNDDVKKIFIKKQSCPYLPLNLGAHFKGLETLYVMNSNVQHLLNGDLAGLEKLKVFDASHNPIEQLGRDFFAGHGATLKIISFFDCHLKVVHPEALEPLEHLDEAHFQHNICIDYHASTSSKVVDLKAEIIDKCPLRNFEEIFNHSLACSVDEAINMAKTKTTQTLSFTPKDLIITFLVILIAILSIVLFKILRSRFGGNWMELKDALI